MPANGLATFTGLKIDVPASYTITATDTTPRHGDPRHVGIIHRDPGATEPARLYFNGFG